jgi:hypothetical protein
MSEYESQEGPIDAEALVEAFIGAWNLDSEADRLAMLASCCEEQAVFISEDGRLDGIQALSDSIERIRVDCPLSVVSYFPPQEHHSFLRFRWQTDLNNGIADPFWGDDFVEIGDDGRFRTVVSFRAGEVDLPPPL